MHQLYRKKLLFFPKTKVNTSILRRVLLLLMMMMCSKKYTGLSNSDVGFFKSTLYLVKIPNQAANVCSKMLEDLCKIEVFPNYFPIVFSIGFVDKNMCDIFCKKLFNFQIFLLLNYIEMEFHAHVHNVISVTMTHSLLHPFKTFSKYSIMSTS